MDNATAERVTTRLTTEYGQFHLTDISFPDEIEAGENVTVTLSLVDADDERGLEYVGYRVGTAMSASEMVVLDPGERRNVTLDLTEVDLAAGAYVQVLESQRTTLTEPVTVTDGENATEVTPGRRADPSEAGRGVPRGGPYRP